MRNVVQLVEDDPIQELGFDPKEKKYKTFMITLNPKRAKYILDYHNKDNRKIKPSQVNKIAKSMIEDGFLQDGGALTFNIEGNITEFQHRLEAMVKENITAQVPVVVGVEPECFTKTAAPKPRRPEDEVQRKYPDAKDSEVTVVREISKRRGEKPFIMQNAIAKWEQWYEIVREGDKLIDGFFDRVDNYSHFRRQFGAWASLLSWKGRSDIVTSFLDLLESEVLDDGHASRLTADFREMMRDTGEMANAARATFVYQLLCVCSDRMEKNIDGRIELGMTVGEFNHDRLKRTGWYRELLLNSDNIGVVKKT
jgi:hypothetical protein